MFNDNVIAGCAVMAVLSVIILVLLLILLLLLTGLISRTPGQTIFLLIGFVLVFSCWLSTVD